MSLFIKFFLDRSEITQIYSDTQTHNILCGFTARYLKISSHNFKGGFHEKTDLFSGSFFGG
jgi:hypothetical protein